MSTFLLTHSVLSQETVFEPETFRTPTVYRLSLVNLRSYAGFRNPSDYVYVKHELFRALLA